VQFMRDKRDFFDSNSGPEDLGQMPSSWTLPRRVFELCTSLVDPSTLSFRPEVPLIAVALQAWEIPFPHDQNARPQQVERHPPASAIRDLAKCLLTLMIVEEGLPGLVVYDDPDVETTRVRAGSYSLRWSLGAGFREQA